MKKGDCPVSTFWWLIEKDLLSEFRARRVWPAMLALGVVVALVFGLQLDSLGSLKPQLAGSLMWLAVLLAGMIALDRSFTSECDEGCWQGLLMYPVSPVTVYLAKWAVNMAALAALACLLVPVFAVLADVPLLNRPGAMLAVALLATAGIAAVGTLISALAAGLRHSGSLLTLIVLPLAVPVLIAAGEATRLVAAGDLGPAWWRWVQLLAGFDAVFLTAGALLFPHVIEE